VLGLGLSGLSQTPEFNVFHQMGLSGTVTEPIFSVFLADSDDEQSEITFGGINEDHLLGEEVTWAPVTMPHLGYWQIRIKELRVGNMTLPFCEDQTCRAVVDTGTSLLAVPSKVLGDLQSSLQHPASSQQKDCKNSDGPDLHIAIEGGFVMTLKPSDYARPQQLPVNPSPGVRTTPPDAEPDVAENRTTNKDEDDEDETEEDEVQQLEVGSSSFESREEANETTANFTNESSKPVPTRTTCGAMLMSLDLAPPLGPKLFILGEPMLKKYYTVFDSKRKKVGFAPAFHEALVSEEEEMMEFERSSFGGESKAIRGAGSSIPMRTPGSSAKLR